MNISEVLSWAKEQGFNYEFLGDKEQTISGFSSLSHYKEESITWIKKSVPEDSELINKIQCAVIQKGLTTQISNQIISSNSKELFFAILGHFFSDNKKGIEKGQNTYIGEDVSIGENVTIGCNCVLDGRIRIGDNSIIEHNVTMMNSISIGADCIIHSGTIIGKDGFGFSYDRENIPQKVPHFGGVRIGDRVEVGCNCVIDRGTIDDTIIGDDVKIDSLVIVGHNVEIGRGVLVVGFVSLAGSSKIGDKTYLAPHCIIKNQSKVGNNCFVGMQAIVQGNIGDDSVVLKNGESHHNKNYRRFL